MADVQLVCSVCFKASSHKSNPTLTPESKASSDGKTKTCGVCRQEWVPIRIARELGQGGLVIIRPRPRNVNSAVDYQLCNRKAQCTKRDQCTFAHSNIELLVWNKEREKAPRPPPRLQPGQQYIMCLHAGFGKPCPYGQRCIYAHSQDELEEWERHAKEHPTSPGAPHSCNECNASFPSKQQLDEHVATHKDEASEAHPPIRPLPQNGPPASGYRMCLHVQSGRRCVYSGFCTFAHSQAELDSWNRQARGGGEGPNRYNQQRPPTVQRPQYEHPPPPHPGQNYQTYNHPPPPHHGQNYQTYNHPPPPHHGQNYQGAYVQPPPRRFANQRQERFEPSSLDEFESESSETATSQQRESDAGYQTAEFAQRMRSRVLTDCNSRTTETSFQDTKNGVTIVESTRLGLNLTRQEPTPIEWIFDVTTTSPILFKSVVLLDQLMTDYSIEGVRLLFPLGGIKTGHSNPNPGAMTISEQETNWNITPGEKAQVKVTLKPRAGILGQVVIFDFDQFYMVQGLTVHYLGVNEIRLQQSIEGRKPKPTKKDLYWEQRHDKVGFPSSLTEEGDVRLPEYPLPEKVETLLEQGKYNNVENKITKDNYKRRMHNLLYLEEYQQRKDMSRYDMYEVEVTLQERWEDAQKGVVYAPQGFRFIVLTVDEVLYEGGRSIKASDWAYLHPVNHACIYECYVDHVGKDTVVLKITDAAAQACKGSMNKCSIRFILGNIQMRAMHYSVDQLDLETLYSSHTTAPVANPPGIKRCLDDLAKLELYDKQKNAIRGMLESSYQKVPSLVLGPFGCGKTRTLSECIKLLTLHVQEARVLVCAHSNSAADLYVEAMSREWRRRGFQKAPLFRLYYSGRKLNTISAIVRDYCNIKKDWPVIPSLDEIKEYKVVVSTLVTARTLRLMGMEKGYFTHIFIDEAAQALEAECLIPLCLANAKTKIILAGDHMQLDPPVYSPMARKYGLQQSLLERLFETDLYRNEALSQYCRVQLAENHRSHEKIMSILSKLFYNNELVCKATFDSLAQLPPITFVGVDGCENQDEGSPSIYNDIEAVEVAAQVKHLVERGIEPVDICVLSFYTGQIQHIRQVLRSERLSQVVAVRVDDVQGKEFRALVVSTVRTCADVPIPEDEIDFLSNPKLFNTALTRAREVLIVVGEPTTLCSVGTNKLYWVEYVRQCAAMGSFTYYKPDLFLQQMRTRLATKQLLGKNIKKQSPSNTSVPQKIADASASQPMPATSTGTVGAASTFLQSPPQTQRQIIRDAVTQSVINKDDAIIKKIVEQLLRLKVEQQAELVAKQEFCTVKVREMEGIMAPQRQQPLAQPAAPVVSKVTVTTTVPEIPPRQQDAASGNPLYPIPVLGGDLPPFLANMVDALTQYNKFCDNFLQHPLSTDARTSIEKQKANVMEQIRLTNDQIVHYKNFVKIFEQATALAKAFSGAMLSQTNFPAAAGGGDLQFGGPGASTFSTYFSPSQDTRNFTQPVAIGNRFGRSEGNGISQPNGRPSDLHGQKETNDVYLSDEEFD